MSNVKVTGRHLWYKGIHAESCPALDLLTGDPLILVNRPL